MDRSNDVSSRMPDGSPAAGHRFVREYLLGLLKEGVGGWAPSWAANAYGGQVEDILLQQANKFKSTETGLPTRGSAGESESGNTNTRARGPTCPHRPPRRRNSSRRCVLDRDDAPRQEGGRLCARRSRGARRARCLRSCAGARSREQGRRATSRMALLFYRDGEPTEVRHHARRAHRRQRRTLFCISRMYARRTARSLPRAAGAPPESRAPKTTQLRHSQMQNIQIRTRGRHDEIQNRKRYQNRVFKK